MITAPERSADRDAAIAAMLPLVPELGWGQALLRQAGAEGLFAGGPACVVEAYVDWMDRRMVEAAAPLMEGKGLSGRVRTLIAVRFGIAEPHRDAVRRAVTVLALPANAAVAARCTARTVDAIWHAAGDNSADFSWYTKRAILAGVYTSTLLYWLRPGVDETALVAFLDRRLADARWLGSRFRRAA